MSAPFTADALGPGPSFAVAVLIGIAFGFVLERAGFGSSRRLAAQFYLYDMTVFKVMFTAIVTAMIGLFGLSRIGFVRLDLVWINPTFIWPQIAGGFLLGVGFIVSGYCPGTSLVAAASGKIDAALTVAGVVAGSLLFGVAYTPAVAAFHEAGSYGRLLLSDLLAIDPSLLAAAITLMAAGAFIGAEALERRFARAAAPGRAPLLRPALRNGVLAALVLVAVAAWIVPRSAPAAAPMRPIAATVTADEVARRLVEGNATWTIVDVRDAASFAKGSIPGSMNVTVSELATETEWGAMFAPGDEVLVVGETGAPAALRAPQSLRVAALRGGFAAWSSEVLAPPPPPPAAGGDALASYNERAAIAAYLSGAPAAAPVARVPAPAAVRPAAPKKAGGGC